MLYALEPLEGMRRVLLCMLEGELCLLDVLEVVEVMPCVLLRTLEAVEGTLCCSRCSYVLEVLEMLELMRCCCSVCCRLWRMLSVSAFRNFYRGSFLAVLVPALIFIRTYSVPCCAYPAVPLSRFTITTLA